MNKWFIGLVVLGSLLLASLSGALSGLIIKGSIDDSNAQQRDRLHHAQVIGCFHSNTRQAAVNANGQAEWQYEKLFAMDLSAPTGQPKTAAQVAEIAAFSRKLNAAIHTINWTPLVRDCTADPTDVRLPVHFDDRQPGAGDLPQPTRRRTH